MTPGTTLLTMPNLRNLPRARTCEKNSLWIACVYVEVRQVRRDGASHVR